jgi:hypothetical protein
MQATMPYLNPRRDERTAKVGVLSKKNRIIPIRTAVFSVLERATSYFVIIVQKTKEMF